MSLEIKINLPDVDPTRGDYGVSREALDRHLSALGFERQAITLLVKDATSGERASHPFASAASSAADVTSASGTEAGTSSGSVGNASPSSARERGKPAPGRARRTKEEIAEDEASDAADAAASDTQQGISTGEARVGPEDDAETQAQDADDEAAEAAAAKGDQPAPTADDLRNVMGQYAQKHGMPATQEDGIKIFEATLGKPPAGAEGWTISLTVSNNRIADAIEGWKKALASGKRFGA